MPSVGRVQQEKFTIEGIAKRKTLCFRETGDGVQEEFLAFVGVLQSPGLAAVGRFVYARLFAFAARHHVSGAGIERHDAAKVEGFAAFDARATLTPRKLVSSPLVSTCHH